MSGRENKIPYQQTRSWALATSIFLRRTRSFPELASPQYTNLPTELASIAFSSDAPFQKYVAQS